jgi:hypothetical protein
VSGIAIPFFQYLAIPLLALLLSYPATYTSLPITTMERALLAFVLSESVIGCVFPVFGYTNTRRCIHIPAIYITPHNGNGICHSIFC